MRRLDHDVAARVRDAVLRLAELDLGDVRTRQGREGEWRLRVGQYRVLFGRDQASRQIVILRVLPRGRAH